MNANKSVAHRLGRVLEKVTRQSGRLPDTPDYGSWLLGKSSESQLRRRVRIQVILTVFILSANVLGIAVAPAAGHRGVSGAERLQRRAILDHVGGVPGVHRSGSADRHVLDHPPDGQRAAVGDRGAHADPRGSAQRVPGAVAGGEGASDPVGCRDGAVHDAVRDAEHDVHSAVPVHHQLRRRRRRDRLLPADRVRAASGGGTGARSRPAAASADRRNHGPTDDRVVSRLAARGRHRTARGVRSLIAEPHRRRNSPLPYGFWRSSRCSSASS